ncbi:MAG: hypothetical protein MJA29_00105 [Candidatus Omnitrophica bacterium]|nr:hypothetical protein [Candidatus Omnitrophota bacterium]
MHLLDLVEVKKEVPGHFNPRRGRVFMASFGGEGLCSVVREYIQAKNHTSAYSKAHSIEDKFNKSMKEQPRGFS